MSASWHMVERSQDGMCGKGNTFLFGLKMIEILEHIFMLTGGSQYRGNFDEAGKRIW